MLIFYIKNAILVVQYGTDATIRYDFTDEQNQEIILNKVGNMEHTLEDHTYAGIAINLTVSQIFPGARNSPNQKARRVMVRKRVFRPFFYTKIFDCFIPTFLFF